MQENKHAIDIAVLQNEQENIKNWIGSAVKASNDNTKRIEKKIDDVMEYIHQQQGARNFGRLLLGIFIPVSLASLGGVAWLLVNIGPLLARG